NDLLNWLYVSCASHARLFQFAALAAHEGFFQIIGRGGNQPRRTMSIPATPLLRRYSGLWAVACWFACLWAGSARVRWAFDYLHQVQIAGGVLLETLQHGLEHLKRFLLVLDQRIVL